jgi:hypothetical protein
MASTGAIATSKTLTMIMATKHSTIVKPDCVGAEEDCFGVRIIIMSYSSAKGLKASGLSFGID